MCDQSPARCSETQRDSLICCLLLVDGVSLFRSVLVLRIYQPNIAMRPRAKFSDTVFCHLSESDAASWIVLPVCLYISPCIL